jgi:hypothetical protein
VARALLVTHQEGPDVRIVVQRVEERDDRAAGETEDGVDAGPLQAG